MPTHFKNRSVLFVTRPLAPPWDEASKNFAYELARHIRGVNITILTHGRLGDMPRSITQAPIYSSVRFDARQKLRLLWFLFRSVRRYDIVHLLFTPTKENSRAIKPLTSSRPIIQTVATLREDLYSEAEIRKMLFGDTVVTYTEHTKKRISPLLFGVSPAPRRVQTISPGIDFSRYFPQDKNSKLMERWGIQKTDTVLSYSGEYTRLGNTVDTIVDGFVRLVRHSPPAIHYKLLMAVRVKNAADAQKKKELIQRLSSLGELISKLVIFTDTLSDMPTLYNLSDIVLFPAEDLRGKFDVPLVVPEAYACEKPVILSDLPQFGEFANDTISVTIPKGDTDALVRAIHSLAVNKDRRHEMGRRARVFALEKFSIETAARRYEELYMQSVTYK